MRSFIISTVCISAFLITGADQVFSQDSWNMELIGKAAYDGGIVSYCINGDYVYIFASRAVFSVVDISDPARPHRVRTVAQGISVRGFLIVDSLLYASTIEGGVAIYDIRDPSEPIELTIIDDDLGFGSQMKWFGNYIGVSLNRHSFNLVDISEPLNPQIATTINADSMISDFEFYGDYLLLTERGLFDGYYYLNIYDLSDISNPVQIYYSEIENSWYYVRFSIIENYAYIYYTLPGIQIYDISDPHEPELVNTVFDDILITDILASGDILYAAKRDSALLTVDVSDPANPVITNEYETLGLDANLERHCLQGDNLYFICASDVISFLDVTDPNSPELSGRYIADTRFTCPAKRGNYVYLGGSGLRIFDISDPTDPVGIDLYFLPDDSRYCMTHNELLLVVNWINVVIYSLNNPRYPEYLSTVYTDQNIHGIYADGYFLYIANDGAGFLIFNIDDPENPYEIGHYPMDHQFNYYMSIITHDDIAFTAEADSGIGVYNIADPSEPVKIGSCSDPHIPRGLFYKDDILYVADVRDGLLLLDVSDPGNLSTIVEIECEDAYDVFVEDHIAYVAAAGNGLFAYDVSDPTSPELIGTYDDGGYCRGVIVDNDTVYTASANAGGLSILRYTETVGIEDVAIRPGKFQLDQNHPNPFNAKTVLHYSLPESGVVTLSIYNILGQQVMTLFAGEKAAGKHTIAWDASDFPSGVYFARLETPSVSKTIKMVLLK